MKKWERAEINCIEISATEHQWWPSCSRDGGYFGDGEISGWFGPDPAPAPTPTPCPAPTPDPEPTPSTGDVTDQIS